MSEIQLVAERLNIKHYLDALKTCTAYLQQLLQALPDLHQRTTALVTHPRLELPWHSADPEEISAHLRIFSQFAYVEGQDPREAKKFPAVIQLHPQQHHEIRACLTEINQHKDALNEANARLKNLMGKQSAEVWQEIQTFASIIQILRHISVIDDQGLRYIGLSYMTKPVVKKLNKEKALCYIDEKIHFCTSRSSYLSKLPFLGDVRQQIEDVDERYFEIKMARQGAPRYMVNGKSLQKNYQVMASLPVFAFVDKTLSVSLPLGKKRKQRKDKRIPLGEIKSEFGLYLIPKQKTPSNVIVTN